MWSLSDTGAFVLRDAADSSSAEWATRSPFARPNTRRWTNESTGLVAYAALELTLRGASPNVRVRVWEQPWARVVTTSAGRTRHVRLTAGMVLENGQVSLESLLLLDDPGTRSVESYRSLLTGLIALRQQQPDATEPTLVVVMWRSADQHARKQSWLDLVRRVATRTGEQLLPLRVILSAPEQTAGAEGTRKLSQRRRASDVDSVLHLRARHPLLSHLQLADLLGVRPSRIKIAEAQLIERGWLRTVELPQPESTGDLGMFVELTPAGRREATRRVLLHADQARRNQGLRVPDSTSAGRQRLRHLAHTVGVNDFFAELARLARLVRASGGDDVLVEWRSAAACQRGRFRTGTGAISAMACATASSSNMTAAPSAAATTPPSSPPTIALEIRVPPRGISRRSRRCWSSPPVRAQKSSSPTRPGSLQPDTDRQRSQFC